MKFQRIVFIGNQGAGKTTALESVYKSSSNGFYFKFAQPIYDVLKAIKQEKHRAFMQQFSDLAKEHFGNDIFNKIAEKILEEKISCSNIYCDDCRYFAELDLLKKYDFKAIFIDTPEDVRKKRIGNMFKNPNHNSELEIYDMKNMCDAVISNDDSVSLYTFKESVIEVVSALS